MDTLDLLKSNNAEFQFLPTPEGVHFADYEKHADHYGIELMSIFHVLIFKDNENHYFAVQKPICLSLDSSSLKKLLKTKSLNMVDEADLVRIGLKPGTVPGIGIKDVTYIIDESVKDNEFVYIGIGNESGIAKINSADLVRINKSIISKITKDKKMSNGKKRILTGDRPTGKLHIGHLVGSLKNRVALQEEYETFILMANIHALSDNSDSPAKVRESIVELLCDYYAVGLDFEKATVFIQSEVPEIHEIFMYLSNFTSVQRLQHNPTLKTEIKQNNMDASTPLGFFIYPIHQAADILCVNADLVPVGKDQAPMIEDTREIARKFNSTYGVNVLHEPQSLFGTEKNLPGTDGNAKMGKSLNNCIYLSDSSEELRKKVFSVYTDPNRIRATDPGTIEGNVAFEYHDVFNSDKEMVADLKSRYQEGKVGDVEVKQLLYEAMELELAPIRERRIEAESMKTELLESALEGSKKVRGVARGVADQMKEAMMIKF